MLVSSKKLLLKAQKQGYAVGQFNVYNLESAQAVIAAAEREKSPIILGITEKSIDYVGLSELALIIRDLAKMSKVPIALHLDHGRTIEVVRDCLKAGFTSVMFDGSFYNLGTNIKLTQKAVKAAHNKDIQIEAELGRLGFINKKARSFTDPDEAEKFVKKTKVDSLAIAVGTSHGAYKFTGESFIDIERIKLVRKKVQIPLVLHGASGALSDLVGQANRYGAKIKKTSGVPDELIKKAIKVGISKINIDTDLRLAFNAGLRQNLSQNKSEFDPRQLLKPAYKEITEIVSQKIKLFGSKNKIHSVKSRLPCRQTG
jgi:fructose-bisphosphate aldolase class II